MASYVRRRAASRGGSFSVAGQKPRWLEMLLFWLLGFYTPQTLSSLGWGDVLYSKVPGLQPIVDQLQAGAGGGSVPNNPWNNGGLVGFGKTAGVIGGLKVAYDYQKSGKLGAADLNAKLPLFAGLIMDDASGGGLLAPAASPMSSGGGAYWS